MSFVSAFPASRGSPCRGPCPGPASGRRAAFRLRSRVSGLAAARTGTGLLRRLHIVHRPGQPRTRVDGRRQRAVPLRRTGLHRLQARRLRRLARHPPPSARYSRMGGTGSGSGARAGLLRCDTVTGRFERRLLGPPDRTAGLRAFRRWPWTPRGGCSREQGTEWCGGSIRERRGATLLFGSGEGGQAVRRPAGGPRREGCGWARTARGLAVLDANGGRLAVPSPRGAG